MKLNSFILSMLICSLVFDQISSIVLFKRSLADDFAKQVLKDHNYYRKKHCVDPLVLDDEVQRSAQKYAQYLADKDMFEHRNRAADSYGENTHWMGLVGKPDEILNFNVSGRWYDEIRFYNYNQPGYSWSTGHFTQLVWKDSQKLGVGIALTKDGKKAYIVAHYSPGGNFPSRFPSNVLKANC